MTAIVWSPGSAAGLAWGLDIGASKVLLAHRREWGVAVTGRVSTPADPFLLVSWLAALLPEGVGSLGVSFAGAVGPDGRVST